MAMNNMQLVFVGLQESIFSNFIQKLSCIHDILFFAKLISCSNTDNLYMHITVTVNFKRVSCMMYTAPQHQTIVTKHSSWSSPSSTTPAASSFMDYNLAVNTMSMRSWSSGYLQCYTYRGVPAKWKYYQFFCLYTLHKNSWLKWPWFH